jgi:hypothetical protein
MHPLNSSKTLALLLISITLSACAQTPPIPEARQHQVSSLLITKSPAKNSDHAITREQATKDLQELISVLTRGYGGAKFVPQDQFAHALIELRNLETTLPVRTTAFDFCRKTATIIHQIPDRNLEFKLGKTDCDVAPTVVGNVGPNFGKNISQAWEQNTLHISPTLEVPVISIHSFPPMDDSQWLGFQAAIESETMSAEALVIDLRGNTGGSDGQGYWLAHELYGASPPSGFRRIVERQTPEALMLLINSVQAEALTFENESQEVPEDTSSYLKYYRNLLRQSYAGDLPAENIRKIPFEGKPFDPKRGYTQRIYILVDRKTESSGESTLAILRTHPKAKVIGENTYGAIHFGNQGLMVLPESGITVRMGTHYLEDKDGKYYEVVGYPPDVRTPQGEDAINWVKADLARKF